jgi:hypothetical protein
MMQDPEKKRALRRVTDTEPALGRTLEELAATTPLRSSAPAELPVGCGARVGPVGTVRSGVDGAIQVLPELGMVLRDPCHRLADGAGNAGSSTLGR